MESEKRYHEAMRRTLMITALRTFQSATFCSCFDVFTLLAILSSRRVAFLRFLFLCSFVFFVRPVSSSSVQTSSAGRRLSSYSSLVDMNEKSEPSSEEYAICFPSSSGIPNVSRSWSCECFLRALLRAWPFPNPAINCALRRR